MKIPASVRRDWEDQSELNALVQEKADPLLGGALEKRWHYESRLKELESFAQKVETGRIEPGALEDFFACTIVVPTLDQLADAEQRVRDLLRFGSRRPRRDGHVPFKPEALAFDHVRLYMRLRQPDGLPGGPLYDVVFEVQIKTFFQHAWSIATHDLTYKSDKPHWGLERLGALSKAAIESTEISLSQAERLAESGVMHLARSDSRTSSLRSVIDTLLNEFERGALPTALKRVGDSVLETFEACDLDPKTLGVVLATGRSARNGSHPTNLSPYYTVLQYIIEQHWSSLENALRKSRGRDFAFIPELTLPAGVDGSGYRRVKTLSP